MHSILHPSILSDSQPLLNWIGILKYYGLTVSINPKKSRPMGGFFLNQLKLSVKPNNLQHHRV